MIAQKSPLLVLPQLSAGEYIRVTPKETQWEFLHFAARRMKRGERWEHNTGDSEFALVILGGVCSLQSSRGNWEDIGRRSSVFQGLPYALYLPRHTEFSLVAQSDELDVAYGWCATEEDHASKLITPDQVTVEIRGGRQRYPSNQQHHPARFRL